MQDNLDGALSDLLKAEGGYVNNPKDPGGPTNKGITLATARRYISPSFTTTQLQHLSIAQAEIVYTTQYAAPIAFNSLPTGLDIAALDYSANSGPGRPCAVLRRICGLPASSKYVDTTLLAAIAKRDVNQLIDALCDERLAFMRGLTSSWATFGKGWSARVATVRAHAHKLAIGLPTVRSVEGIASAKAILKPVASTANLSAGAGTTAGAFAAAYPHFGGYIALAVALVVVAGVAILIAKLQAGLDTQMATPAVGVRTVPQLATA